MPLVTQLDRNSPTVQIASVLPSAVLSSTNNQCSSSGLGMHIPADSSNVRNAQGVNLHSHSVLIPPSNSSPQDPSTDRLLPKTQIPIPGRDSQVPLVITNDQNPSTIQIPSSPILFGSLNAVIENGLSSVIMVNIDNAANPNITTVDAEVGNARVIGMEDMENGRNMAVLGQTFSADKSPDIGASVADKLITDPVPQEMINVCNIANAALINDVVGVEVGSLDISPMVVDCGNQEGDGTDNVGISLESPILPDHENSLILVESDSQILVQMVKGLAAIPWKLQDLLKRIKLLFGMMNLQISHIYREANGLADFLASFAVHSKTYTEFSGSNVLPVAGRLILQQDQTGLPNVRLKRILYPLGGNNTISMPLISQVNQTKPTVRLASVLPANVSTAVNDQSSSSGLGYHVPIESVIDRNTQRVLMNPPPSLIPQSIPLEILESSMDRNLNKSQIPASDKDTQIPIVISNSQIPS
ncbi:unnamed protein product, partial [Ilex paraguariensis]